VNPQSAGQGPGAAIDFGRRHQRTLEYVFLSSYFSLASCRGSSATVHEPRDTALVQVAALLAIQMRARSPHHLRSR
jgi:hypothetical protein